ncbi:MAG: endonuclease MutS2 [Clostridiales bacterium]|jgi:DNA mismatch repair protein MutS2|nr:endonuclease MutS2 [Clostridiales bacterium]
MEEKTLNLLEFHKIKALLRDEAGNYYSKNKADGLLPSASLADAEELLCELAETRELHAKKGSPKTAGIRDVTASLKRAEIGGTLRAGELLSAAGVLRAARELLAYRAAFGDAPLKIDAYFNTLTAHKKTEDAIFCAILSEDEIADGASPQLAQIRRGIANTHARVREHLNGIIHGAKYRRYLQESIVTMRDGRYVVPVKAEHRADVGGIVHDMSATGATLFIEPNAVVEANNALRELEIKEKAEIERILAGLTAMVAELAQEVYADGRAIGELDYLFAKARLAAKIDGVIPALNNRGLITLTRARHPLLDPKTVVPVTVTIGGAFSTLVVTGPNTGGKTVLLKTIGLLSLMAAAGLAVPAGDGTALCVFENVFADIGDEQSIEQSLSTFSSHMTNIVRVLEALTPNSLVLFDELGAGTDPTEGAALAVAILAHTQAAGATTVATTHYSELKMYALTTDGVENASCEFDVHSLRPTYRLLVGVPGKSNAFAISKRLGLSDGIIDSANRRLTEDTIRFEDIISSLEASRQAAEEERAAAEQHRREAERLREELRTEQRKLDETKQRLSANAKREAKRITEDAKREADALIEEIKRARQEQDQKELNRVIHEAKRKLNEKLKTVERPLRGAEERSGGAPKNLLAGTSVYLSDIGQSGTVLTPPKDDGTVTVQVGILKITSHLSNLRLAEESQPPVNERVKSSGGGLRSLQMKSDLDLRGNTLDDALLLAEKYIDDAYLASLSAVTIIHGKGTGVLRKGIHEMLKRHPHIKSYRLGAYGEGESGVTVAELK